MYWIVALAVFLVAWYFYFKVPPLGGPYGTCFTKPVNVVVTGGNRGVGGAIVEQLVQMLPRGSKIVYTSTTGTTHETLRDSNPAIVPLALDLYDVASVESFPARLAALLKDGKIDLLFNNAGFSFPYISDVPFGQQAIKTNEINFFNTVSLTRRLLEMKLLSSQARIVNVSSMAGQRVSKAPRIRQWIQKGDLSLDALVGEVREFVADAQKGEAFAKSKGWPPTSYGVSKAALTQATRIFARDFPQYQFFAVCPGLCQTGMTSRSWRFRIMMFLIGHSAAHGANTPIWLAAKLPWNESARFNGKFVSNRKIGDY